MKIQITFNINDFDREAINAFYGDPGKADYKTARQFIEHNVESELENQAFSVEQQERGKKERLEREAAEADDPLEREIVAGPVEYP